MAFLLGFLKVMFLVLHEFNFIELNSTLGKGLKGARIAKASSSSTLFRLLGVILT